MSDLIVIGYPDQATAEQSAQKIGELAKGYLIRLEKIAVVWREEDGKLKSQVPHGIVTAGALGGMFWGMLIGLLFLMPLAGLALGAAGGAFGGKLADLGIKRDFQAQVADLVPPGRAAVFLVAAGWTEDKVIPELEPFGGQVLRTSLSVDDEHKLAEALQGH